MDILLIGRHQNRALEGDTVVIQVFPEDEWYALSEASRATHFLGKNWETMAKSSMEKESATQCRRIRVLRRTWIPKYELLPTVLSANELEADKRYRGII